MELLNQNTAQLDTARQHKQVSGTLFTAFPSTAVIT